MLWLALGAARGCVAGTQGRIKRATAGAVSHASQSWRSGHGFLPLHTRLVVESLLATGQLSGLGRWVYPFDPIWDLPPQIRRVDRILEVQK